MTGGNSLANATNNTCAGGHGSEGKDLGTFLILATSIGLLVNFAFRHIRSLKKLDLPYSVVLLIVGGLVAAVDETVSSPERLSPVSKSIDAWTSLDPHTLMYIFLPPLIFSRPRS